MEPKILRRTLIAYTIVLVLRLLYVIALAFHGDIPVEYDFWGQMTRFAYIVMTLIFLKDLIYRRTLAPEKQYKWVLGFIIFSVFAFWRYYLKIVIPQINPDASANS